MKTIALIFNFATAAIIVGDIWAANHPWHTFVPMVFMVGVYVMSYIHTAYYSDSVHNPANQKEKQHKLSFLGWGAVAGREFMQMRKELIVAGICPLEVLEWSPADYITANQYTRCRELYLQYQLFKPSTPGVELEGGEFVVNKTEDLDSE